MSTIWQHPFKTGIRGVLDQHFDTKIANRFVLVMEAEHYSKLTSVHIRNQLRDNNVICEIFYELPSGLLEYITDVASWWSRKQVEFAILRYVTDKVKAGKIGQDWDTKDGKFVSKEVVSGNYETPDEPEIRV